MFKLEEYRQHLHIYMRSVKGSEKAELDRTVREISRNESLETVIESDINPFTGVNGETFDGMDSAVRLLAKPGVEYCSPEFSKMQEGAVRKVLEAVSGPAAVYDSLKLLYSRDLKVRRETPKRPLLPSRQP